MNNKLLIYFILLLFGLWSPIYGQVNSDSIFRVAINNAKEHQYEESINNCKTILEKNPGRADVMVFIANVYAWQGKSDSAKIYINNALSINKKNKDAYASWMNILLWNKEYETLINTADIAESNGYDNKYDLLYKRLLAEKGLRKYDEALALLDYPQNKVFLDSAKIDNLHSELLLLSKNKKVTVSYSIDLFDKNAPQHLAYVDYGFKIRKQTLILRANYAHKFQKNGVQVEADYYRSLRKGYTYFNYGYAIDNSIFPIHRAGAEYYFPIIKSLEGSIGGRFLYFANTNVYIATGSLSKYAGNNLFSIRPFYTFKSGSSKQSVSMIGNYRLYGKNTLYYWGLELGYGNSPDERLLKIDNSENFRLHSYKAKLERNFMIGKTSDIKISAGYAYEEYYTNNFRNRYSIEVQYKFRLK